MTVDEMLGKLSARELTEWRAFELMSGPINPYERLDRAAALIAERITFMLSSPKERAKLIREGGEKRFMPRWDQREVSADGDDS